MEHKVSLGVIKLLFVKTRNLGIASFVIGVTCIASLRLESSVKTRPRSHVRPNILVTIPTQHGLRIAVEPDVALFAVVFQFGMPLNDFARRQNGLDALCARQPGKSPAPCHQRDEDGELPAM